MMKIIITGATGYLGNELIEKLNNCNDFEVFSIVRKKSKNPNLKYSEILIDNNLNANLSAINPDLVVHLASFLSSKDDLETSKNLIASNISFGAELLDGLKGTNLKWFINTGTFAEYHNNDNCLEPTYLYAASKTAFKSILSYFSKVNNFKVVNLIPYTIYGKVGKSKKIIDILIESEYASEPIGISNGNQIFDFIHITDVIDFYLKLILNIDKVENNSVYHIGTGKGTSLKELAIILNTQLNTSLNVKWGVTTRNRDTICNIAPLSTQNLPFEWKPKTNLLKGLDTYIKLIKSI